MMRQPVSVVEDELAIELNVSRTTIRTALHSLEQDGIITRQEAEALRHLRARVVLARTVVYRVLVILASAAVACVHARASAWHAA